MLAVAVVALTLWAGVRWLKKSNNGATLPYLVNGVEIRLHLPNPIPRELDGDSKFSLAGVETLRIYWLDGYGRVQRNEYVMDGMRLRVRGTDYGTLKKGDVVDIDDGWVKINGRTYWGRWALPKSY